MSCADLEGSRQKGRGGGVTDIYTNIDIHTYHIEVSLRSNYENTEGLAHYQGVTILPDGHVFTLNIQ